MKIKIGIFIILFNAQVFANMANPVFGGTLGGSPFVSQFVDVLHEDLFIRLDKNFDLALFKIRYHIKSSKDGFQIPFLFYASDISGPLSVKIDGVEVSIKSIPYNYNVPENTKFKDFSYFFEKKSSNGYSEVEIKESPNQGFYISLNDMVYFETNITKGKHVIEVSYNATQWKDTWNWVNEFSFRYALSPAKYWKSFGSLHIKLDASQFDKEITTNLGKPQRGNLNSIAEWRFDHLPTEILQIIYIPKISKNAQVLINIGPRFLAFVTGAILFVLHLLILIWYRKRYLFKDSSLPVIFGSILVPLFFLLSWMNYYDVIDSFIGEYASKRHGYTFFVLALYPIITPVYWLVIFLIDKQIKKNLKTK